MPESVTTPPYLYKELANVPTHKLVVELQHRIEEDGTTIEICPEAFIDLATKVMHG